MTYSERELEFTFAKNALLLVSNHVNFPNTCHAPRSYIFTAMYHWHDDRQARYRSQSVFAVNTSSLMDDIEKSVLRRRRSHIIEKLQVTDELLQDLHSRQLIGQDTIKDIMASFVYTRTWHTINLQIYKTSKDQF